MTSQWRHILMTSSKSVKIGSCHNFWTNYPLIMIDPSFFMFCDALLNKIHIKDVWSRKSADVSSFNFSNFWWRHDDVTARNDVTCRIFLLGIISLIDILLLSKFQVSWIIFSQDMMISFFAILYRIFADLLPPSDKTGIISHRIIEMSQFFPETCKTKLY